jgi:hypothetical protein
MAPGTTDHQVSQPERGAMDSKNGASSEPTLTVALDVPSARVLADQAVILQDLQFVMECCKRLLTELGKPEDHRDPVVPQALWSAALTAYARCFGKGKHFGLETEDVRAVVLQGEVMKFHRWVIGERNKLATHPADPFAGATVGAALSPPAQPERRIEGIAVLSTSHVLVDDTGVRQLGGLASELAKNTVAKAQQQQDHVLDDAQQLSIDRLYRQPPLHTGPPPEGAQ